MTRVAFLLLCAFGFFFGSLAAEDPKIRISSFSTILTEIAEQVGGSHVQVTAHIKPGMDPHSFEPKPNDLAAVARSNLVLLSAKHMESYVPKLQESSGGKGEILEVGDQLPSLQMEENGRRVDDPHWWHSVANVKLATNVIRDALIRLDPEDKSDFLANAAKYQTKLDALQNWIKVQIARLPRDKRKLVTSHDAFQYFAKDYGFTIYPIQGITSEDEPSSKKVADLIRSIKEQHVKAIFPETLENPKVLTEVTRETGATTGGELVADGLGDGDAATYEGMMKHNVNAIVGALK